MTTPATAELIARARDAATRERDARDASTNAYCAVCDAEAALAAARDARDAANITVRDAKAARDAARKARAAARDACDAAREAARDAASEANAALGKDAIAAFVNLDTLAVALTKDELVALASALAALAADKAATLTEHQQAALVAAAETANPGVVAAFRANRSQG
jgi:hypothetical protein